MKANKAPGPDGITSEVYKVFWNQLGPLLLAAYTYAYDNNKLHNSAMEGVLNLIPKPNKDGRYLKNLRPITLLNVDYKIIEKAISNRLREAMEFIISEDQTGFMSKRRMAVNVRKLLDVMDISNIEKIPALILSLDYKKAFDLAEVDAVLKSLEYFKFAPYLVKWTRILYTNFTVRIQNNGYFSEKIDVQRSVHQGGCASAFLFNILVETMAIELRKHEDIRPLTVNGGKTAFESIRR